MKKYLNYLTDNESLTEKSEVGFWFGKMSEAMLLAIWWGSYTALIWELFNESFIWLNTDFAASGDKTDEQLIVGYVAIDINQTMAYLTIYVVDCDIVAGQMLRLGKRQKQ